MMLITNQSFRHLYSPFTQRQLIFSSGNHVPGTFSFFDILDEIDLYHQPVEEPKAAFIFCIIRCILTIVAELCNYRVIYMMKKDSGILKEITKLQAYTIMILLPIRLVFITLTDFLHPLHEILGRWVCSYYWFVEKIAIQMIGSHSLFVAILRYFFIVHDEKVIKYGKEKLKSLFWYVSICIPILTLLWIATDLKELDTSPSINRCNGKDHKMFLLQSWSSLGYVKKSFVTIESYTVSWSISA